MQEITVTPLEALDKLIGVASMIDTNECKDEAMYNALQGALVVAQTALAMAPKQEAQSDTAEGVEMLDDFIDQIKRHGNYSKNATLTFLNQIRQCFAPVAAPAAANGAPASNSGSKNSSSCVLTDEDILTIIWKYSSFISVGNYSSTQFDCQTDTLNCVRAILAAAGQDAALPDGYVMAPLKPTHAMIKAMAESRATDDEGEFPAMLDLLDFSGENKTHTVLEAAYVAALSGAKGN